MEMLFYIGMIIFGFYCLVTEPIEKVEKDFGIIGARNKDVEIRLEDQSWDFWVWFWLWDFWFSCSQTRSADFKLQISIRSTRPGSRTDLNPTRTRMLTADQLQTLLNQVRCQPHLTYTQTPTLATNASWGAPRPQWTPSV